MSEDKKTSLSQLYQQRKSDTPMPEHLKKALVRKQTQRKVRKQWWVAMPTAMASLLVVVILWPSSESVLNDFHADSVPILLEESYLDETTVVFENADVLEMEPEVQQSMALKESKELPAPAAKSSRAAESPNIASDSEAETEEAVLIEEDQFANTLIESPKAMGLSMDDAMPSEQIAAQELTEVEEKIWQVVDGRNGQFKDCDGEPHTIQLSTDIETGTWVKVLNNSDNTFTLEVLDSFSCGYGDH